MAHRVWQTWLEAYAEGRLRWPMRAWVELHTKRCQPCRHELRAQLSFMERLDDLILGSAEIVDTVVLATRKELDIPVKRRLFNPKLSMMLSGATVCVILLIMLSLGLGAWLGTGATVVAASGWSTGVATTVSVNATSQQTGVVLTSPSGYGRGAGVSVPVAASDEWSG